VKNLNKILSLNITLSYFEKCMVIAFLFFEEIAVEYAIIEV
jgi:folylpolyglutamate synthase/dihydropteroate synthase